MKMTNFPDAISELLSGNMPVFILVADPKQVNQPQFLFIEEFLEYFDGSR